MLDAERDDGRRGRLIRDQHLEAGSAEDLGRVSREVRRLVAGVVADDDLATTVAVGFQPPGESRCGLRDDDAIHSSGAGADPAAEARGAEFERTSKGDGEFVYGLARDLLVVRRRLHDQLIECLARLGIQIPLAPLTCLFDEFHDFPLHSERRDDAAEQRRETRARVLAGLQHLGVVQVLLAESSRGIGHQR